MHCTRRSASTKQVLLVTAASLLFASTAIAEDDLATLKREIQDLKNRVAALEDDTSNYDKQQPGSAK